MPLKSIPPLPMSPDAFAKLVDLAEDAIVSVTADQRIVLFNRGAVKVFGYQPEEIIGRSLELLIPTRYATNHRAEVTGFAASPMTARAMGERRRVFGQRKDGTEFPAEVTIGKFEDGERLFLNAIVRDVTERAKNEDEIRTLNRELEDRVRARTAELEHAMAELQATTQQLWQAAKLASVGELAASIAHELNNPLGTISLRLESVLLQCPPNHPCRSALEIVEGEVERMAELISNLLQFSRPSRDQVSTVDLTDEVTKTAELAGYHLRRRRVKLHFDFAHGLPLLFADRQKLRQVFLNLFTNAGDAMQDGGTLTVRAYADRSPNGGPGVVIEVKDTGVGIPAELLPRVMEPFVSTKAEGKGTGLGLAICRRIIQEHHGSIEISSESGQGTTVRIVLPVARSTNVVGLGS